MPGRSAWAAPAAGVLAPLPPAIEPLVADSPPAPRAARLPEDDIMAIMADPQDQLATIANAMAMRTATAAHSRDSGH
jgi:hypothetical protein